MGKMSGKKLALIVGVVYVVVIGGGNLFYRLLVTAPELSFSNSCERGVHLLDVAVSGQYGHGALRVLDLRPGATVNEKQINEIRKLRRVAVQNLNDNQLSLCAEALQKAKRILPF